MSDGAPPSVMEQLAKQVLTRTLRLRRGESVVVETWTHMLPWANAFVLEARKMGVRPMLVYEDEETYWKSLDSAKPSDLGKMSKAELGALSKTDGYVFMWGPEDRPRFNGLPDDQRTALTAFNPSWYEAAEKAHVRGCRIEIGRATDAQAAFYGVNGAVWRQELLEASLVDVKGMARDAARLAARLAKGRKIRVSHANGTELEMHLARRRPVIDDGIVDALDLRRGNNMTSIPAGGVYVALDEQFIAGTLKANRTSYLPKGAASGGRWTFEDNRLSQFEYESGEERFREPFESAGPGKDQPGFLSIGLNPRLRVAPGLEDLEKGAILMGVGSNSAWGGKIRATFQSWLALGGAHIELDGKTIVADGEIL